MTPTVAQPHLLHLLWLVVALVAVGAVGIARRQRAVRRFADAGVLPRLAPGASPARAWLRLGLVATALALLVVALADVRWGVITLEARRRGLDVVFAVDLSRSMLAEDVAPNRLERAKLLVTDLVERLPGERVGLVAFAGDVAVACPLTLNHEAFDMSLASLDVRDPGRGGSMIGDAIREAGDLFTDAAPEGKIIVVVSDGEDHGSMPAEAAAQIRRERGARVFTVGIGDDRDGAPIPVVESGRRGTLRHEGAEVRTRMERETLAAIATAGEGAFVPVGTSTVDAGPLLERLVVGSERRAMEGMTVRQQVPRFQWFAGAALALLLVETLVRGGRRLPRRREEAA